MPVVKLHVANVHRLPPLPGRLTTDYVDEITPGLVLRVSASSRSFALSYWSRRLGRKARFTLGRTPPLQLAKARELARDLLAQVAAGGPDPHAAKLAARKRAEAAARLTLGALVERAIADLAPTLRPATVYEFRRLARTDLKRSRLWSTPAVDVHRADVREMAKEIAQRAPYVANQVVGLVRRAFNWAVQNDLLEASPVAGLSRVAPQHPRDRVLTEEELRALWLALEALDREAPDRLAPKKLEAATAVRYLRAETDVVRLLLLTGVRRQMVVGMRREELLDIDDRLQAFGALGPRWAIPGGHHGRTKNKSPHVVPLTEPALVVVRRRIAAAGQAEFLFPAAAELLEAGADRRAMRWSSKFVGLLKEKTEELHAAERAARGLVPAPMKPWTIHGLRHAVGTHMREALGARPDVVSMILGHRLGGPAATRLYDRAQLLPERRAVLVAWADWLQRIVRERQGGAEVVPITRG